MSLSIPGGRCAEICCNLTHARLLLNVEGAAGLAVPTLDAGVRPNGQLAVMSPGQHVPGKGEVIIFVDKPHVQPLGTGLAVVAVHADAVCILWGELTDNRIVPLFRRGVQITQHLQQIRPPADTGQHRQHTRAVQRVLEALEF